MKKRVVVKASEVIKYTWELYLDFDPSLTEKESMEHLKDQVHNFMQQGLNIGLQEEDGSGFQIDSIELPCEVKIVK